MKDWKFRRKRQILSIIMAWIMAAVLSACGSVYGEGTTAETFNPVVFTEEPDITTFKAEADEEAPDRALPGELSFEASQEEASQPQEEGIYTDKEQVASYLHLYGHLPDNYITKKEAENLGWNSSKGNLDDVAPGKSIEGGRFGNREGLLPNKKGRTYYECDIDYEGGYRGGKRIVYSNDGLIYYTEDHYSSFELLYTSEGKAE